MDNKLNEKSYNKSKTVRMLIRNEMFEKNRQQSTTYLAAYDEAMQAAIKQSLIGAIPHEMPAFHEICPSNIAYFRRSGKPVFKTKMEGATNHDPHMTL